MYQEISFAFWISCLILFIPGTPVGAQTYLQEKCADRGDYAAPSKFQDNLSSLLSKGGSADYSKGSIRGFYNTTEGEDPDKVYGLFLCRGDVAANLCQSCIRSASSTIIERCPGQKEAIIWYDECFLRYSNRSFFSIMETTPFLFIVNPANDSVTFNRTMEQTFDNEKDFVAEVTDLSRNVTDLVILSESLYATLNVSVSSSVTLYGLAQCTPDISKSACKSCLLSAIEKFPTILNYQRGGARVLQPSCNVRYELYHFYGKTRGKTSTDSSIKGMSYIMFQMCTQFVMVSV